MVIGLDRPSAGRIPSAGARRTTTSTTSAVCSPPSSSKTGCCRGARPSTTCDCPSSCSDVRAASRWSVRGRGSTASASRASRGVSPRAVGCMRQRVALARAFVIEPSLLLADEASATSTRSPPPPCARPSSSSRAPRATRRSSSAPARGSHRHGRPHLVFGRPGRLLADIDLRTWPAGQMASLRADIQQILQNNEADARFTLSRNPTKESHS